MHTGSQTQTYTQDGETKSERMRQRHRNIENTMRGRRNVYNIPVSGYKAHRQRGTGMKLSHSNQAVEKNHVGPGPSSCYLEVPALSPARQVKTQLQTPITQKPPVKGFPNEPQEIITASIPEFFTQTPSSSFQVEGAEESISLLTPDKSSGAASPLRSIQGHEVGPRYVLVVQLPRTHPFKSIR